MDVVVVGSNVITAAAMQCVYEILGSDFGLFAAKRRKEILCRSLIRL